MSYGYNKLDQLISMSGWISGSVGYDNNGRMSGFILANGAAKSISYDSQDRLARLSYTGNGVDEASYTFRYDQASNIIQKNDNTYTYDKINQLVGSDEKGWFQKKPSELVPDFTTSDRDYLGMKILSFTATVTSDLKLDMASRSVGVDLGEVYGVNRIELHPKQAGNNRVKEKDITVYISSDNATTTDPATSNYVAVTNRRITKNSDGSITISFPVIIEARYIKINTIWDDRNIENNSIDTNAQFINSPSELVKVWALVKSQNQVYVYDAIGNRTSLTVDGASQTYQYYKNSSGGSLSWLRYDGQWYYEYDKSGNRTVRAKGLLPGSFGSEAADTSQEYWDYGWDLYNRLVSVKRNGQQIASYAYDTENYRVQRVGSDGTTVYGYDGNGSLTYQRSLTSGVRRSIVYLKGEVIGWTESVGGTSTRYYAETDQLGSVTQVLDQGGSVVWQSEYTAFGTVAGAQGSVAFSGMFAGKDFDSDTGLSYYWNRWRSEDGSRFISEDPARDGANWYAYVGNNPLTNLDPTGLYVREDVGQDITYRPDTGKYYEGNGSALNLKSQTPGEQSWEVWGMVAQRVAQNQYDQYVKSGRPEMIEQYRNDFLSQPFRRPDDEERRAQLRAFLVGYFAGGIAGEAFGILVERVGGVLANEIRAAVSEARVAGKEAGQGFRSFSSFKRAMGPAGKGMNWHHIVEQTPGNISRFGDEAIQNTQNLMQLDETIHQQISGFYSSKPTFSGGQTVRQWLSTQSFAEQMQFGIEALQRFGVAP